MLFCAKTYWFDKPHFTIYAWLFLAWTHWIFVERHSPVTIYKADHQLSSSHAEDLIIWVLGVSEWLTKQISACKFCWYMYECDVTKILRQTRIGNTYDVDPMNSSHHLNCSLRAIDWHILRSNASRCITIHYYCQWAWLPNAQFVRFPAQGDPVLQDDDFNIFAENSDSALYHSVQNLVDTFQFYLIKRNILYWQGCPPASSSWPMT